MFVTVAVGLIKEATYFLIYTELCNLRLNIIFHDIRIL